MSPLISCSLKLSFILKWRCLCFKTVLCLDSSKNHINYNANHINTKAGIPNLNNQFSYGTLNKELGTVEQEGGIP